jgi:hypothetical protein
VPPVVTTAILHFGGATLWVFGRERKAYRVDVPFNIFSYSHKRVF